MNNLKTIFTVFFSITIGCLIVLGIFIILLLKQQFVLEQIDHNRFESYLVADQLKQSSDDLTNYCRVYVSTGDAEWEKKYWEVLDIRNGKKARPDGRKISLRGLMKELGFTAAEFNKLKTAEDNSNRLAYTEMVAFNAMKGLYNDGTGHFTIKKKPDPKLAQTIVFDKKYHADKAQIMKSIEEFNQLLKNRIEHKSKENLNKSYKLLYAITGLIFLIIVISVLSFFKIRRLIKERKEANDKIKQSEKLLKKITSQIPGNTYVFEIEENGKNNIHFMSLGTDVYNHTSSEEHIREIVYDEDKVKFNDVMKEACKTHSKISFQYRIVANETIRWRWMQAVPEKDDNGKFLWYGSTSDITPLVDYIASIEQIIYDIGHVIRRPVSSMLGITKLIVDGELSENEIREISEKLYLISEEMDKFIRELNHVYQLKRQSTKQNFDISSIIDKRSSLFK